MADGLFWDIIPNGVQPEESVVVLLLELEQHGWYPRKCIDAKAVKYWPDNNRGRQLLIDLFYPVNQHKLEFYREHTQLALETSQETQ